MKQLFSFFYVRHGRLRFTISFSFLLLLSLTTYSQSASSMMEKEKCRIKVKAVASDSAICLGGSDSLHANVIGGTAPFTYLWAPPTGLTCTNCPNPVATPTSTTTYTVTVTDINGCTATNKVRIKVNKPPHFNADTLLIQYLTNQPLAAIGGTPPYTYTFAPPVSSSNIVTLLSSPNTFTITVTDANGCETTDTAKYTPIIGSTLGACNTIFISEYIQDTVNHDDGIELYNPTPGAINLKDYYLFGTTNGSLFAPPFIIRLHGTIGAHKTFLIANTNADTVLTHKAKMLSDSLNFRGLDIVALANIVPNPPNVTATLLDEVGAISPLPTDSGWAVAAGSTKNHTLVRQASLTTGDIIWSTCQYQWNVYGRGVFSYIGHYKNICTPTDPWVKLSFGDTSVTCGNPSYFNFDVMVSSDSAKIFNDGIFEIKYIGSEFAGENDITISQTPEFQYVYGDNDYYFGYSISSDYINVQVGNSHYSSPHGTVIDSIPKAMFHISIKIMNSCGTGTVYYDSSAHYPWDWSNEDSMFLHIDSTKTTYTLCCPYYCGDTLGPPYICGYYCCDVSCLDTCYDTCYTYPVYCYDTTWHYRKDSAYSYTFLGNVPYTNVYYSDSLAALSGCGMSISSYTNPINAGTNAKSVPPVPTIPDNSSILIITGTGFGNKKDSIQVSNANASGMVRLDTVDILSWSENLIKIKMPSYLFNNSGATPGSGPIIVYSPCGESATDSLQINYNISSQISAGPEKLRPDIVMANDTESIKFRCDTSITNNLRAYLCVKKAIQEWNCYTGVNWKLIPSPIIKDTSANDSISVIYFSNHVGNFIGRSYVMQTKPWYLQCANLIDSMAFYDEADIMIRRNKDLNFGNVWSYDTTSAILPYPFLSFYDAIKHELGHAHGLDHINDSSSLMFRTLLPGYPRPDIITGNTYPGPATLEGGLDMVETSAAFPTLCLSILMPTTIYCIDATLGTSDISENPNGLNLYPNPINNGALTIDYELGKYSNVQFKITDCVGRIVIMLPEKHQAAGDYSEQINVSNLAQGIYFFTANTNGELKTVKFIKI